MESQGKPPAHFLVLVPGYMGSKLRNRDTNETVWIDVPELLRPPWRIKESLEQLFEALAYPNEQIEPDGIVEDVIFVPPLFKQEQYGRLLAALAKMGYLIDPDHPDPHAAVVYTFPYDWRQDNRRSAQQLARAVEGWQENHPGAKAWLIAHSNGGIVARWYIEKEGGKHHVGRLFLMGSPWDGTPKAMQVLQSGLDVMISRIFNLHDISQRSRDVILTFPSFYQLIPSFKPFLRDLENNPIDPFSDPSWLEEEHHREMLLDAQAFNQELGTEISVETLCFFGYRKPTTTGGVVRLGAAGRWLEIDWDKTEAGDGTIPERSAVHPEAREKLPFSVGHGDIYIKNDVWEKLEWELIRKYRLGVLAEVVTERYRIMFEPTQDVYAPGDKIYAWATIEEVETGNPVFGAEIEVQLKWSSPIPGHEDPVPAPAIGTFDLAEDPAVIGRYEGNFIAPDHEGFYRLIAGVQIGADEPIELDELILVEGLPDPDMFSEPEELQMERGETSDEVAEGETPSDISFGIPGSDEGEEAAEPPDGEPRSRTLSGTDEGQEEPFSPWGERRHWMEEEDSPKVPEKRDGLDDDTGEEPIQEQRRLNVKISDHDESEPLIVGQVYTLAFFVDTKEHIPEASVVLRDDIVFRSGEEMVDLTVILTSKDFIVYTQEHQGLRVPRHGHSKNKARFDIEPKHDGIGEITAYFYRENNFIQGMNVHIRVGGEEAGAFVKTESLGRPLEGTLAVHPRDLNLIIKNTSGTTFDIIMKGPAAWMDATLHITLQELEHLINELRKELLTVVYLGYDSKRIYDELNGTPLYLIPPKRIHQSIDLIYQSGIEIPEPVNRDVLQRLAKAGWRLYRRLFFGKNADATLNAMGNTLRELSEGGLLKIQIVSEQFLLPWGLLYLAERYDPEHIDANRFLGLKHIIEHIPLQRKMVVLDHRIHSKPDLVVSLNVDADIDHSLGITAVKDAQDYWKGIEKEGLVQVVERTTDEDVYTALNNPDTADKIFYFYGHAVSRDLDDPGGPKSSGLGMTGKKRVTVDELEWRAPIEINLGGAPLVFINACESAELSPFFYDGFMPYFTAKGARGMIGTECEVPALFAAEWARRFFDLFLSGKPVGEVFLHLRQEFYRQHNNLLGLLYALYCDGDTQIDPGLGLT